jgi:RNase H-fold protein (predicted Holliday junction resolvase)
MARVLSIDPGKSKCGLVLAEINEKRIYVARVINSELLENYIKNLNNVEDISKIIIGDGTTSKETKQKLNFFKNEIITFEEKNTTFRAKKRYFELFPIKGLKFLIPREVFILNKNLDAISALIILEDYFQIKFILDQNIDPKTWRR